MISNVDTYRSIFLSIHPSTYLSLHPPTHPSIHLSIHPSIHQSKSIYVYLNLSIYISNFYIYICRSISLSIYLSIYLSVSLSKDDLENWSWGWIWPLKNCVLLRKNEKLKRIFWYTRIIDCCRIMLLMTDDLQKSPRQANNEHNEHPTKSSQ